MTPESTSPATRASLRGPRDRRARRARLGLVLVGALLVGGTGASAAWQDTAEVRTNTSTGTLSLTVDAQRGNPTPVVANFPLTNLRPGDRTERTYTVRNTGSVPGLVRVTGSSAAGAPGLASVLNVQVLAAGLPITVQGDVLGSLDAEAWQMIQPGGSLAIRVLVNAPGTMPSSFIGASDTSTLAFTLRSM